MLTPYFKIVFRNFFPFIHRKEGDRVKEVGVGGRGDIEEGIWNPEEVVLVSNNFPS